ncbi:MAG: hypothetical protein ACREF7_01745, partial [Candidatus Saccharimonadales bacterium]
ILLGIFIAPLGLFLGIETMKRAKNYKSGRRLGRTAVIISCIIIVLLGLGITATLIGNHEENSSSSSSGAVNSVAAPVSDGTLKIDNSCFTALIPAHWSYIEDQYNKNNTLDDPCYFQIGPTETSNGLVLPADDGNINDIIGATYTPATPITSLSNFASSDISTLSYGTKNVPGDTIYTKTNIAVGNLPAMSIIYADSHKYYFEDILVFVGDKYFSVYGTYNKIQGISNAHDTGYWINVSYNTQPSAQDLNTVNSFLTELTWK